MNLPIKDLKKETLVELTDRLKKNFVWEDNKLKPYWYTHPYPKKCYRAISSNIAQSWYHQMDEEWCKCLDGVFKKLKLWKIIEGENFPFMSNRVGNKIATLYLVSNGIIYCNRADCDHGGSDATRCISPLPQDLLKFFEPAIIDKLNEWLKKLDLAIDPQEYMMKEVLIK